MQPVCTMSVLETISQGESLRSIRSAGWFPLSHVNHTDCKVEAPVSELLLKKQSFSAPYFLRRRHNPINSSFLTKICFQLFHGWWLMKSSFMTFTNSHCYDWEQWVWEPWLSLLPSCCWPQVTCHISIWQLLWVSHNPYNLAMAACSQTSCTSPPLLLEPKFKLLRQRWKVKFNNYPVN